MSDTEHYENINDCITIIHSTEEDYPLLDKIKKQNYIDELKYKFICEYVEIRENWGISHILKNVTIDAYIKKRLKEYNQY